MTIVTVGIDLAKNVFVVHDGQPALVRSSGQRPATAAQWPCVVCVQANLKFDG
jgi:hypothetical protein